ASNKEITEVDCTMRLLFFRGNYQNASPQLCTALDKFAEKYRLAKSKSISQLTSYLYDLNHNLAQQPVFKVVR
ncbi:1263_t:CDS:1, partial [Paraglomus brasilianum]